MSHFVVQKPLIQCSVVKGLVWDPKEEDKNLSIKSFEENSKWCDVNAEMKVRE